MNIFPRRAPAGKENDSQKCLSHPLALLSLTLPLPSWPKRGAGEKSKAKGVGAGKAKPKGCDAKRTPGWGRFSFILVAADKIGIKINYLEINYGVG